MLLSTGDDSTQQYAAKALEWLARDCVENQIALVHEHAADPLTQLLASDSIETQESAVTALLCLASHADSRNLVIKGLVGVLEGRNTSAQLKASEALGILSQHSTGNRQALAQAGAIEPLVALLGHGHSCDSNTPPERAAAVLADLARLSDVKERIASAGGLGPLVAMLSSGSEDAQTHAAAALHHLATAASNKPVIIELGAVRPLIELLVNGTESAKSNSAGTLWHLATSAESKTAIVMEGGTLPLIELLTTAEMPEARESAAAVLSELARSQSFNRNLIADLGGIEPLTTVMREGSPAAQKHATCALWGLAQEAKYRAIIASISGAVGRVVELLNANAGETQGFAAAMLVSLAQDAAGKEAIMSVGSAGPLMKIALGPHYWLRSQAIEVLKLLGYPDPSEKRASGTTGALSPRLARYKAELVDNPAVWMMTDDGGKIPINDEHMAELACKLKLGDRVLVDPGERRAEVQFIGKIPELAPGFWIGVQYDDPVGKNDGSIRGRRCFDCALDFGGFLRPTYVRLDLTPPAPTRTGKSTKLAAEAREPAAAEEGLRLTPGRKSARQRPPSRQSSPAPSARGALSPRTPSSPRAPSATARGPPPGSATARGPPISGASSKATGSKSARGVRSSGKPF